MTTAGLLAVAAAAASGEGEGEWKWATVRGEGGFGGEEEAASLKGDSLSTLSILSRAVSSSSSLLVEQGFGGW